MKKRLCFLAVLLTAALFFSCGVSASVLTLYPETVYSYCVHLCGEFLLEGTELESELLISTNAYNGATLTLSDESGKSAEALLSEVKIGDVLITQEELSCGNFASNNTLPVGASDKLLFTATASLDDTKTEPSTLIDFSTLSLDAEIIIEKKTEELPEDTTAQSTEASAEEAVEETTENTVNQTEATTSLNEEPPSVKNEPLRFSLSGVKIDKVVATKADTSFGSDISFMDFNHGKGLKNSEREEIALSEGAFTVKAKLLEPVSQTVTAELKTDFSSAPYQITLEQGAQEAVYSVSSDDFYNIETNEFFKTMTLTVQGQSVQLKSLKIYYSADTSLSGAMRFREFVINKGAKSEPLGDGLEYWYCSPRAIAGVNSSGQVTGKEVGTAKVTAYDTLWRSYICAVKVISSEIPSTSVSLPYAEAIIRVGSKYKLPLTFTPSDSTDAVNWTTSDSSVVRINSKTGELVGVAPGTATITAVTSSGKAASCTLTVKLPE